MNDDWKSYYSNVEMDYKELKIHYPFCNLVILPTVKPEQATIRVVAANKDLIHQANAIETDFLGKYSRELLVEIPINYRESGCKVFGASWVDVRQFKQKDIHFYTDSKKPPYGFELCVGIPESFPLMKNVILENIKTAENILIAYERVMTGASKKLELIAYAHGDKGREQYQNQRKKYITKR